MIDTSIKKPSLKNVLLEGRAPFEAAGYVLAQPFLSRLPAGQGRAVLVLPGFGASDTLTIPLRRTLKNLNYRASAWNCGVNRGWSSSIGEHLVQKITRLYNETGQKISIVGWSLGGVYARELARHHDDKIHSVITLGSPFSGNPMASTIYYWNRRIHGREFSAEALREFERRMTPPPVRSIAIHTKTDGVVSWQCSLEPNHRLTENIETKCSHIGLVYNPRAIKQIALALRK